MVATLEPLTTLNDAQRAAATFGTPSASGVDSGPLLVIAGAGTGKTTTLAHRVAHLALAGVDAERILLLTFSRRAAYEMTRRAERIVREVQRESGDRRRVRLTWSGTFHSIANRLLRQYAANVGLDPAFTVLDRGDAADCLDLVRQEQGLSARSRRFPRKDTCLAIYSRCVNAQASLEDVIDAHYPWCSDWQEELSQLFRGYVGRKQKNAVLDYDDLLLYWLHAVAEPKLAAAISARFDHLLVDEYQDTNKVQAGILRALRPDGQGLTVVGDDAQSIYAFRAAEVDNILDFPDQFVPAANIVTLEQNYRSTQTIVKAANSVINKNTAQLKKSVWTQNSEGELIDL
ncbi:MAG: ATP-dependent helicase, partial [Pseudomonadota bacterium]